MPNKDKILIDSSTGTPTQLSGTDLQNAKNNKTVITFNARRKREDLVDSSTGTLTQLSGKDLENAKNNKTVITFNAWRQRQKNNVMVDSSTGTPTQLSGKDLENAKNNKTVITQAAWRMRQKRKKSKNLNNFTVPQQRIKKRSSQNKDNVSHTFTEADSTTQPTEKSQLTINIENNSTNNSASQSASCSKLNSLRYTVPNEKQACSNINVTRAYTSSEDYNPLNIVAAMLFQNNSPENQQMINYINQLLLKDACRSITTGSSNNFMGTGVSTLSASQDFNSKTDKPNTIPTPLEPPHKKQKTVIFENDTETLSFDDLFHDDGGDNDIASLCRIGLFGNASDVSHNVDNDKNGTLNTTPSSPLSWKL